MAEGGSVAETTKSDSNAIHRTEAAQESSIDDFAAPEARFECPICLAWLRDPVLTACGHRFCRNCIQEWLEKENACPVDNMKLNKNNDIFPDNFTRREISQQRTKCPNLLRGCLVELSPLDIDNHLLVCEFRPPEPADKFLCTFVNVGCYEKFKDDSDLQKHLDDSLQHHLMLLSQAYSKTSLSANSENTAALATFWDPPAKGGGESSNSINNQDDNFQNLLRALYEKVIYLEQKVREQDIIIANMSEKVFQTDRSAEWNLRYCNGSFIWKLKDFKGKINAMRENPKLAYWSSGFYTTPFGYKVCLRINLSPQDLNSLAILIHIMKSEHDQALDWPFCGRISITVVHPVQSYKNVKETMMSRPGLQAFNRPVHELNVKGFGYTEFISIEELFDQDFIANNQLLLKVDVQSV